MTHFLTTMTSYYWEKDGRIVVQNTVGMHMGQKHDHTPLGFELWRKQAEESGIIVKPLKGGSRP